MAAIALHGLPLHCMGTQGFTPRFGPDRPATFAGLVDAFAEVHGGGANVGTGPGQVCTSYNAKRVEWVRQAGNPPCAKICWSCCFETAFDSLSPSVSAPA
eukprot:SAG22_NODE_17363_length_306_cov_0.753623_1_plen_100_part_10